MLDGDEALAARIRAIQERIDAAASRSRRAPSSVRLVAVSKTMPAAVIAAAVRAGHALFGENRVQEAADKIAAVSALEPDRYLAWHLVGHLQSNKAKAAVGLFELIHSVDGLELAGRLDRSAAAAGKVQGILLQVNVASEATKSGVSPEALFPLTDAVLALPHLALRGLMTIPPHESDPEGSRRHFAELRRLGERVRASAGLGAETPPGEVPAASWELSMGMTEDFEIAIEEGATLVRVGRAIFGERG